MPGTLRRRDAPFKGPRLRDTLDPLRLDELDEQILAALSADGRATFDAVGRVVGLSAPATKRRVDRLRARGVIRGFTTVLDPAALGGGIEAVVELFYAPGVELDEVRSSLLRHPEVVEAWSVSGEADCLARVRVDDPADLERLIRELQRTGSVLRTRSQVVLSRLVERHEQRRYG